MIKIPKIVKILGLFFAVIFFAPKIQAQDKPPKPPNEKEQYKALAKKEKQAKKSEEKSKKQYHKKQSKTSKKNMKRTKKKSDRNRNSKGAPFWEGWFIKH